MEVRLRSVLEKNFLKTFFSGTTLLQYYKPNYVGKCDLECVKESDEGRMKGNMTEHLVSEPEYEVEKGVDLVNQTLPFAKWQSLTSKATDPFEQVLLKIVLKSLWAALDYE